MTCMTTSPLALVGLSLVLKPVIPPLKHVIPYLTLLRSAGVRLKVAKNMFPIAGGLERPIPHVARYGNSLPQVAGSYMANNEAVRTLEVIELLAVITTRAVWNLHAELCRI